ncbi:MAG: ABC transporter permease [Gammaproteobacteria bacterium]|nr:ABC transporter permease [Gammaproteobacteria bacterium]
MNKYIIYLLSPLFLLSVWEICSQFALIDVRFYPPPSEIFHYLIFTSPDEGLFTDIRASLSRILWGYLLGSSLGVTIGIGMGINQNLRNVFFPLVAISYPIPKIAILPLIMLIFGIGELSKIVVVAIGSFFLVLMSTLHGVESLAKVYRDVAFVYQFSRFSYIRNIVIPGALPSIFTGLKLAIGYSLVIVVAAEFSGANEGIGYLIWQSWETFSIKAMYAGIFVIALLGFTFTIMLDFLQKRFTPWHNN